MMATMIVHIAWRNDSYAADQVLTELTLGTCGQLKFFKEFVYAMETMVVTIVWNANVAILVMIALKKQIQW